jgi:predicted HicB family RNase H-like nuclease
MKKRAYTVRDIPEEQYKALRLKAAGKEISINKTILQAIERYLKESE